MVNVSGRSKGCSTCRRRRVKCDLTQPTCLRCQRGGLECDGPKQELAFHEATIVSSRRKVEQSPSGPSTSSISPGAGPSVDVGSSAIASPSPAAKTSTELQLMDPSASLRDDPQEVYIMFTRKFIADGGPVDLALRELQSRDITRLQTSRTADCKTAHLRAVLSFATTVFGTKQKQTSVIQQGYLSHGTTLKHLNQALSEPNCHEYDEIIVSVTTLAMQEMLVPSGPKFFLNHMMGLDKLLALRNPQSPCSPRTLSLYKCLRYMLLFAALSAGRASVLAKPGWKSMFSQHCESEEETQEQLLYDNLADCSLLVPVRDNLLKDWETTPHDERAEGVNSVRRRADDLLDGLRAWRGQWLASPGNAYTETPAYLAQTQPSTYPRIDETPVGITDLVFPNIASASLLMLHNIACLHVLQVHISLPFDSQSTSKKDEYFAAAYSTILEICRSMPYCLDEELHKDLHAGPVVFWAVQVADMVLKGDASVEGRFLKELLGRKSGGGGSQIVWET